MAIGARVRKDYRLAVTMSTGLHLRVLGLTSVAPDCCYSHYCCGMVFRNPHHPHREVMNTVSVGLVEVEQKSAVRRRGQLNTYVFLPVPWDVHFFA